MESLAPFGELLKTFRLRQHLTQQELAELLGVHRNTIGTWERGNYLPESKTLVLELARQLDLAEQETRQFLEASLTTFPPYWSVPLPRNLFFTGREEILKKLHTQLRSEQVIALTHASALHGLGGVGKTQIALEYAYRYALEYSAVFWIGAETEEQIILSLLHIAEVLRLPERDTKDQQHMVAAVQRWLATHGQWLLIWDNVEELTLLDRFLPSSRSGAILITTRRQILGTFARGLDLLPMEQEEGMLFLLRRAKVLAPDATRTQMHQLATRMPAQCAAAEELVQAVGGLPLALDQAGAYLEATRCGVSAYLDLFRARCTLLLQQRGEGARDHPASVSTTFTLAIATSAKRHPAVWPLLCVCALLHPDAIPEELFRQGGEHLGTPLQAICHDALEWNQMVGVACSYSLLSRPPEEQVLSIHRLVQVVLLDTMTGAERELWSERVIKALDAIFPEEEYTPSQQHKWRWKLRERLMPHVMLRLHEAGPAHASLPLASLAFKTARFLYARGQYTAAEPLYQRTLHIQQQALDPDHPDIAHTLNALAITCRMQGKHAEAEALYQRALQMWEQALGPDHPDVATALNGLAVLSWKQGKHAEAEALYQRALQIWEQTRGPDHPAVAIALNNLAALYHEQGKYVEAEALYQRALQMWEQALGPDHP
ncbi:MAG TPA: tetratricopeptide repeat protein, partial [Ktedonobacteraceae bacterium]